MLKVLKATTLLKIALSSFKHQHSIRNSHIVEDTYPTTIVATIHEADSEAEVERTIIARFHIIVLEELHLSIHLVINSLDLRTSHINNRPRSALKRTKAIFSDPQRIYRSRMSKGPMQIVCLHQIVSHLQRGLQRTSLALLSRHLQRRLHQFQIQKSLKNCPQHLSIKHHQIILPETIEVFLMGQQHIVPLYQRNRLLLDHAVIRDEISRLLAR